MCGQPVGKYQRREQDYPGEEGGPGVTYMPPRVFDAFILPRIQKLLESEGADIACSSEDKDLIYGFRAGNKNRTHLIFLKSQYRRFGIAGLLCSRVSTPHTYTMSTPTERRIRKKGSIPEGWVYDPNGMWRLS